MNPFVLAAAVCVCAIPAVCIPLWKKKRGDMKPLWMGVLGFVCFAGVAESVFLLAAFTAFGPVSDFLRAQPLRLIAFSCLCAGIFEEFGRAWIFRNGLSEYSGRDVAAAYAAGHFCAEIMVLTLWPLLSRPPASFGAAEAFWTVLERVVACAGHAALSIIVWSGLREGKPGRTVAAAAAHAACDFPLGMFRYGLLERAPSEAAFGLCVTILCIAASGYWQRLPEGVIIEQESDA